LGGQFPYSKLGLLDRTHLRFFAEDGIHKLFEEGGYFIGHFDRQQLAISASEVPFDSSLIPPALIESLSRDPSALTYQFILVAYPLPKTHVHVFLKRFREITSENDAARATIRKLQSEIENNRTENDRLLAMVDSLQEALEGQGEAQGHLSEIEDAHAVLQEEVTRLRGMLQDVDAVRSNVLTQLREQNVENDTLRNEVRILRDTVAERTLAVTQLREQSVEAHGVRAEVSSLRDTVTDQTAHLAAMQTLTETLTRQRDDLRQRLLVAHDSLVQRDDEIQQLRSAYSHSVQLQQEVHAKDEQVNDLQHRLNASQQYIQEKETHVAALQSALDRILYSRPGRIYRRVRTIVTLGKK
jgi:chromosome segregation ATPase